MSDKIFSVGQAATWLAKPNEPQEVVANQLRRFRKREYVKSRGTFGAGPTATNTFNAIDLGVAKLCRAMTALGISDSKVMEAVSDACYDGPAVGSDFGATPGMAAALNRPHAGWSLFVYLSDQEDGSQKVFAEVRLKQPGSPIEHPAIDALVELPMHWLPSLTELAD